MTAIPDRIYLGKGSEGLDPMGGAVHAVDPETDGIHEVTVENPHLLTSGEWYTDIHWYPSIECA